MKINHNNFEIITIILIIALLGILFFILKNKNNDTNSLLI